MALPTPPATPRDPGVGHWDGNGRGYCNEEGVLLPDRKSDEPRYVSIRGTVVDITSAEYAAWYAATYSGAYYDW
jgi:hypothetical protein